MEQRNTPVLAANHPNLIAFIRTNADAAEVITANGKRTNGAIDGPGAKKWTESKGIRVMRVVCALALPREVSGAVVGTVEMGNEKKWETLRKELGNHSVVDGPVELDFAPPSKTSVVQHRNIYNQEGRLPSAVRKQHQILVTLPESSTPANQLPLLALESVEYDSSYIMCANWIRADTNGWMRDCAQGEGGLLDALVNLSQREEVRLTSRLMMMLIDGEVELQLTVDVDLVEQIWRSWETISKRIFVKNLFSLSDGVGGEELGLDEFYAALKRAPATRGGLRNENVGSQEKEEIVEDAVEETEEEKLARERTLAKGKGKERLPFIDLDNKSASTSTSTSALPSTSASSDYDDAQPRSAAACDDVILRPEGLLSELMPFQSRTVRWLLEREGKYVVTTLRNVTQASSQQDGRKRKRKATSNLDRAIEMIEGDEAEDAVSDEDVEVEERVAELRDLPEAQLSRIRRGPLWELRKLQILDDFDSSITEATLDVWINRLISQISLEDPANWSRDDVESAVSNSVANVEDTGESSYVKVNNSLATGSMLCEEMGLGKTVEVISLILLNQQPGRNRLPSYRNEELETDVEMTGITLIITPDALIEQWSKEIRKHAGESLSVLRYDSLKSLAKLSKAKIRCLDVVLTTFNVLKKEMNIALKPHSRSMRQEKRSYERSFFVRYHFLRVVMDEVQMVGEQTSKASLTCALIARKFSLAVSGTPLLDKIEHSQPLLKFLQIEPLGSSSSMMRRFLKDRPLFERVLGELGERTTKSEVKNELTIPAQTRFLVPVEFEAVEKYFYDGQYMAALEELGFDLQTGAPIEKVDADGVEIPWVADKQVMNRWLQALRLLCIHPQGGQNAVKANNGDRAQLGGNLGTLDEVLAAMINNQNSIRNSSKRSLAAAKVSRGLFTMHDRENCLRFEDALDLYREAMEYLEPVIEEVVESITSLWLERKAEAAQRDRSASTASHLTDGDDLIGNLLSIDVDANETAAEELPSNIARTTAGRLRLRELLLVKHQALFFTGSAYFNLGKFPDEENEAYSAAEHLRTTITTPYERMVLKARRKLKASMEARVEKDAKSEKPFVFDLDAFEVRFVPLKNRPGLTTREVFARIEETTNALNGYAELIWQARDMVLQIVHSDVSNGPDGQADGEEYGAKAELQERGDIYLEGLKFLLGDWRFAITGEKTALNDVDENSAFSTRNVWRSDGSKRRRKSEKGESSIAPILTVDSTPGEVLQHELWMERHAAKGGVRELKSLRELIKSLKEIADITERVEEQSIATMEVKRLAGEFAAKSKIIDRMRTELSEITTVWNTRLEYFVQVQKLSDSVSDPDFSARAWKGVTAEIANKVQEEAQLENDIANSGVKLRYLTSLTGQEEAGTSCVICTDEDYAAGVLTSCGHLFCEPCIKLWRATSDLCPVCKRRLAAADWQRIVYRKNVAEEDPIDEEEEVKEAERTLQQPRFGATPLPLERVKLSYVDPKELSLIKAVDTAHRLSAKSTLIVKHVKLIRRTDTTAKIVIFSTWTESLAILMQAFVRADIQFCRLEGSRGKAAAIDKFINDENVGVFFLHTRSAAAGLNLTCAQYIFLLEPLLQASVEQQAISRIHRIGQTKETQVYQYYVVDSVDQRVAELRAREGTSLFVKDPAVQVAGQTEAEQEDDETNLLFCLLETTQINAVQRNLLPRHLRGEPIIDYIPPAVIEVLE